MDGWMGDAQKEGEGVNERAFVVRSLQTIHTPLTQAIYPVSRAQRAVCKGRVAAHSVS